MSQTLEMTQFLELVSMTNNNDIKSILINKQEIMASI